MNGAVNREIYEQTCKDKIPRACVLKLINGDFHSGHNILGKQMKYYA